MGGTGRPLIAGNWKMNGLRASEVELRAMLDGAADLAGRVDLLVCPPATLVARFVELARETPVAIGGQDCHTEASGAFTGDISAEMLADAGATVVIVGHSERRTLHGEADTLVQQKALAARRAGLAAIVCVGETREQREAGKALDIVGSQLAGSLPDAAGADRLVIAYEPVWAIGTGLTPTTADVAQMHAFIRERLVARYAVAGEGMRILYGGSVKPANAGELLAIRNVDGALIGGASLKGADFLGIARVCR